MRKTIATAIGFVCLSAAVKAGEDISTTRYFKGACPSVLVGTNDPSFDLVAATMCLATIEGFNHQRLVDNKLYKTPGICSADNIGEKDAVRVWMAYIDKNPSAIDKPAVVSFNAAMESRFPCK